MTQITEYINPGLLVLIPALYILGVIIKQMLIVPDRFIPALLGLAGIVLAVLWVVATSDLESWRDALLAVFTALVQGILCAGAAVYANQLYKQSKEDE